MLLLIILIWCGAKLVPYLSFVKEFSNVSPSAFILIFNIMHGPSLASA